MVRIQIAPERDALPGQRLKIEEFQPTARENTQVCQQRYADQSCIIARPGTRRLEFHPVA